jgi:hypothetical protein
MEKLHFYESLRGSDRIAGRCVIESVRTYNETIGALGFHCGGEWR